MNGTLHIRLVVDELIPSALFFSLFVQGCIKIVSITRPEITQKCKVTMNSPGRKLLGGNFSIAAEWQHDNGFDAEADNFFRTEDLDFFNFDNNYSDSGEINRAQEKESVLLKYTEH